MLSHTVGALAGMGIFFKTGINPSSAKKNHIFWNCCDTFTQPLRVGLVKSMPAWTGTAGPVIAS
jgi:hypothetical protein